MRKRWLLISLLLLILGSFALGPQSFSLPTAEKTWLIIWQSRLPRTLALILSGSSMALSGLLMQTLSRNPFAGPSTTGTVEGAKFGILFSMLLFPVVPSWIKLLMGFGGASFATLLFFFILDQAKDRQVWDVPLLGTLYGQIIGAAAAAIAYHFDLVQSVATWQQGNFSRVQIGSYEWLWAVLPIIILVYHWHPQISLMQLGRDAAMSLGLHYDRMHRILTGLVALIVAVNVMSVGVLPFLGIIIPNLIRIIYGDRTSWSIPIVMMSGASFVLVCDLIARTLIAPYEMPVGLIMTIFGGIIFLVMVFREEVKPT